jgi:hypothetical protein
MKLIQPIILLILSSFAISALADVRVNGYYRQDGTYVQPYYKSDPNGNPNDNFSTKGNVNPYTGKEGTHNPQNNSWQNKW